MGSARNSSLKKLLRELAREVIWHGLNRHRPGSKPAIALVGSRRSGSTLLMQMIAQNRGLKSVNQPFSLFVATSSQMSVMPFPYGGIFVSPPPDERAKLLAYIDAIVQGRIHVQEPNNPFDPEFKFRSDRIILKTTAAHFIEDVLAEAGCQLVRYLRHPVAQSISCSRNGWGDKLGYFAGSHAFRTGYLPRIRRRCSSASSPRALSSSAMC